MRLSERMPDLIGVRVARDEKRRLAELARQRGVSLSDLIRQTVAEAVERVAA